MDRESEALGMNDPDTLLDYEAIAEEGPHPATRDAEYLQHSSLWGHQYLSGKQWRFHGVPSEFLVFFTAKK